MKRFIKAYCEDGSAIYINIDNVSHFVPNGNDVAFYFISPVNHNQSMLLTVEPSVLEEL